ncbi:putative flavin-binding monooxygenase [Astrocystis sublimbata]|nr:putative flavin-binding monooxygenase [Astrocystis sublimbata]
MGSTGLQNKAHGAETFDVIIVGAGISGINAAYRLQSQLPGTTFTILEGRGNIGGTWDLFRYPGIRSDSDLFTFGFQWEPWPYDNPIAEGPLIREYMKSCAKKHGIDRHIRFHHKVQAADWSTAASQWTLTAEHDGQTQEFRSNWVVLGTGYYDYENPLKTVIPGLGDFRGKIIHPQHWPEDYDHSGKKIAIIGSGATAVTLLPALSDTAAEVTMVQRSPTYIISYMNRSPKSSCVTKFLPTYVNATWIRMLYSWGAYAAVLFTKYFPQCSRYILTKLVMLQLPARISHSPHFEPAYTPWQQRLCLAPDGDFFRALREKETTNVITGHIDTVTENGIRMKDGTTLDADVIVTATGLRMRVGGKVAVAVDGEEVVWGGRLLWQGTMIQDVPNMMFVIGYVDASWTLGADSTAHLLVRLLKHMKAKNVTTAIPRVPPGGTNGFRKFFPLESSYRQAADAALPRYGNTGPWLPKISPPWDSIVGKWGDIITGLHFAS